MVTQQAHQHVIVLADEQTAAMWRCAQVPGGHLHCLELRRLINAHQKEHEHLEPAMMARGSPAAPQQLAAPPHTAEEERTRFARDIKSWLRTAAKEFGLDEIGVFASPRFLSVLREELGHMRLRIHFHAEELTRLSVEELRSHPAIISAMKQSIAESPRFPAFKTPDESKRGWRD